MVSDREIRIGPRGCASAIGDWVIPEWLLAKLAAVPTRHTNPYVPLVDMVTFALQNGYTIRLPYRNLSDPLVVTKIALIAGAAGINAQIVDL